MRIGALMRQSLAGGAVLLVVLAGCATDETPAPSEPDEFAQLVDSYLAEAESQGYGAEQVRVLEEAREASELAYEDYATAVDHSLECISAAGFHVERYAPDESRGFLLVSYFYEGPESGNPAAEACIRTHSEAIESVWQLQPVSVAAQNERLEQQVGELKACLAGIGVELGVDGLEGEELNDEVHRVLNEQIEAASAGSDPALECFALLTQ